MTWRHGSPRVRHLARQPARRQPGFTLLELLIALSIFSLVSVLSYGGLQAVLDARRITDEAADRLGRLQVAMTTLGRDLEQAVARPWLGEFGVWAPAMRYSPAATRPRLELVRAGARAGAPTALQRVGWELRDGILYRLTWERLDGGRSEPDIRIPLLGDGDGLRVDAWEWRFTEADAVAGQAVGSWPGVGVDPRSAGLPQRLILWLDVAEMGRIERSFPMPGAGD